MINLIHKIFLSFGINLPQILISIYDLPKYFYNLILLYKSKNSDQLFKINQFYPVLGERFKPGGYIKGHYFIQDLYVAQKIYKSKPPEHFDLGSRVDGFIAHLATFMNVTVLDIRPVPNNINGINFIQFDINNINSISNYSIKSISSLHVFEHIGLGRYGDKIDYNGHVIALNNIYNMLVSGGIFYFSVPIGRQRIVYNAHRVFSVEYLISIFFDKWEILEFTFVDDKGKLYENYDYTKHSKLNLDYGCGIFILKKL